MFVCVCVCIYIYIYTCMHTYIYTHTNTYLYQACIIKNMHTGLPEPFWTRIQVFTHTHTHTHWLELKFEFTYTSNSSLFTCLPGSLWPRTQVFIHIEFKFIHWLTWASLISNSSLLVRRTLSAAADLLPPKPRAPPRVCPFTLIWPACSCICVCVYNMYIMYEIICVCIFMYIL
jgi:hypothetical protein